MLPRDAEFVSVWSGLPEDEVSSLATVLYKNMPFYT